MNTRKYQTALSLTCMVVLSTTMVACGVGDQYLEKLKTIEEAESSESNGEVSTLVPESETPTQDTNGDAGQTPDLGAAAGEVTTYVQTSSSVVPPGKVITNSVSTDLASYVLVSTNTDDADTESDPATPEPEPIVQRPAVFNGDMGVNEVMGAAECVDITDTNKSFGQVNSSDWRNWFDEYTYSELPEYLDTGLDGERAYLRQKLLPTSYGSHHVQAGSNLSAARTYRITQSLYFEPGFDWGGKNEGGKVGYGLGGGSAPSGGDLQTDGFTLRLMWRGNQDGTAKMVAYSYAADRGLNLPYGDEYQLEGFEIPIGEWFDITLEVKTNSSTSASDGSLRAWTNGQLRLQRDNIAWQTSGNQPAIQKLVFTTFYGGNDSTWSPSKTTYIRFADACWAPVLSDSQQNDPTLTPQQPAMLLDEAVQTPRGRIIQSVSDMEELLPTDTSDSNGTIYNALDAINRSLSTDQWLDNNTVKLSSRTVSELSSSVTELSEVASKSNEAEYVREQSDKNAYSLVYAAYTLTEKSRLEVEDRLTLQGCTLYDKTNYCSSAYLNLNQADEWLRKSNTEGLSHQEQMTMVSQAWLEVNRAAGLQ